MITLPSSYTTSTSSTYSRGMNGWHSILLTPNTSAIIHMRSTWDRQKEMNGGQLLQSKQRQNWRWGTEDSLKINDDCPPDTCVERENSRLSHSVIMFSSMSLEIEHIHYRNNLCIDFVAKWILSEKFPIRKKHHNLGGIRDYDQLQKKTNRDVEF